MTALRVVLADDHYLVREGTRRLLEDDGAVDVVASVGSAVELLDAVRRLGPDAVVTDIRMPPGHHMEGIDAALQIRRTWPGTGVVVLSQHSEEAYAFALFAEGTDGLAYLLKERVGDLDEIVRALREVVAGRAVVDPQVVEALVGRRARQRESPLGRLTPRELDVLREMAAGRTNAGIGAALHLSESAVEKHAAQVFAKLLGPAEAPDTHRRVAAVVALPARARLRAAQRRYDAPFTSTTVPLAKRAPGEASHSTASATSSGRATRPNGDCARTASPAGPSSTSRAMSVSTNPGATVATEIPCGARATAIDWPRALRPALLAP